MAAGIPGVGIGGLFYVVSAAAAPLRELHRALTRGERLPAWGVAFRLFAMALAIVAGMWVTSLLVGTMLQSITQHTGPAGTPLMPAGAGAIWRVGALVLSVGTLSLVLAVVQIARLTLGPAGVRRRAVRRAARRANRSALLVVLATAGIVSGNLAVPHTVHGQSGARGTAATSTSAATSSAAALRARAETVYATGERAASERAYAALLEVAPNDSRALFRLAALRADRPAAATALLARYVALEPTDAWGWAAYADALSLSGQHEAADAALDRAERIAPAERDVLRSRARASARAGRTDAAIALYEALVAADPADEQAWQGLAEQRRRAGRLPEGIDALERAQAIRTTTRRTSQLGAWRHETRVQVEPTLALTRDSDENTTRRAGVNVRLPLIGRAAISVAAAAVQARNTELFPGEPSSQAATVSAAWRPRAAFSGEATVGATQVTAPRAYLVSATPVTTTTPTANLRLRWRSVAGGPAFDVRASRVLLDATPELLANRVVRTEVSAATDVPLVAGFRARASARGGQLTTSAERANTRTLLGASLVRPLPRWGDLAVNVQRVKVARATTQGYFAPRSADIAELGTYVERESEGGVLLAIDAGVGVQRMQAFTDAAVSSWQPAARLWSHLDVPLGRALLLRGEVDLYDGGVAREAAATTHWRWLSASLGVRVTP